MILIIEAKWCNKLECHAFSWNNEMNFRIQHFNEFFSRQSTLQANENMKREVHSDQWNANFTKHKTKNVIYAGKEMFRQANETFETCTKRGQSRKKDQKTNARREHTHNLT